MRETQPVAAEDYVPEVREPAGYRRSDADIASELREHLADDVGLDAQGIEIEVKGGEECAARFVIVAIRSVPKRMPALLPA